MGSFETSGEHGDFWQIHYRVFEGSEIAAYTYGQADPSPLKKRKRGVYDEQLGANDRTTDYSKSPSRSTTRWRGVGGINEPTL